MLKKRMQLALCGFDVFPHTKGISDRHKTFKDLFLLIIR